MELEGKDYAVNTPVSVKAGVEVVSARNTRLMVNGNFNAFELERDASLVNPNIFINAKDFASAAIYLDGKHKYYNSWFRAGVINPIINNWSGGYGGIGIYCYAGGEGHEVSFVNFENPQIIGMGTAIKLEAVKPKKGIAWVNANRFTNVSIDDCVNFIELTSAVTVPNECSGNQFTNMQLQPSGKTKRIFDVCGSHNKFDGMLWESLAHGRKRGGRRIEEDRAETTRSTSVNCRRYVSPIAEKEIR